MNRQIPEIPFDCLSLVLRSDPDGVGILLALNQA